jgi:hypothetical protein
MRTSKDTWLEETLTSQADPCKKIYTKPYRKLIVSQMTSP